MATKTVDIPLVVIVGPTAAGKTTLAIEIAKQFNGEIICADSRTVYKGMDIATAKPSILERQGISHFGLDLVAPNERFSVADFKQYADKTITRIKKKGKIPILVGGTGLYVDAVLFDYSFGSDVDKKLRFELQHKSLQELYDYCKVHRINLPENYKNKRYVIRAIESKDRKVSRRDTPVSRSIIVGITTDTMTLQQRINDRIEQQLENGVVDEAILLGEKYGWESESMKANMYPLLHQYIKKDITIDVLKAKIKTTDWHLAKRQMTWFHRNKFIHWMTLDEANTYLSDRLVAAE